MIWNNEWVASQYIEAISIAISQGNTATAYVYGRLLYRALSRYVF